MFQQFSGKEYLKIDIANNYGKDKLSWNERIEWFDSVENQLHSQALLKSAEEPALFYAGVQAWERTQKGEASGYPISLDATCSGIQVLAALACDRQAATLCNMVDTGHREDAYTAIYQAMVAKLGETSKIDRKLTKKAIMTAFYGSTAQPKNVFGEGEMLDVFYETMRERAPGAWEINEAMLAIWDDKALLNSWVLPDNFHVQIKVMGKVTETVHFLNEPFEVAYNVNMPISGGRSLGANMVHSLDGMIVREMVRRCNYDAKRIAQLEMELVSGHAGRSKNQPEDQMVLILWGHYLNTGFLSARILDYLNGDNMGFVDRNRVYKLIHALPKKPFEILTVHDCFRVLPNYGNDLRRQYNLLLSQMAESNLLSHILSQITGRKIQADKLDPNLSADILETNYALS